MQLLVLIKNDKFERFLSIDFSIEDRIKPIINKRIFIDLMIVVTLFSFPSEGRKSKGRTYISILYIKLVCLPAFKLDLN